MNYFLKLLKLKNILLRPCYNGCDNGCGNGCGDDTETEATPEPYQPTEPVAAPIRESGCDSDSGCNSGCGSDSSCDFGCNSDSGCDSECDGDCDNEAQEEATTEPAPECYEPTSEPSSDDCEEGDEGAREAEPMLNKSFNAFAMGGNDEVRSEFENFEAEFDNEGIEDCLE